jgi:hypothetical protein
VIGIATPDHPSYHGWPTSAATDLDGRPVRRDNGRGASKRLQAGSAPVIGGIFMPGLRVLYAVECEDIRPGDRLE